jgi:hypothetical protein
MSNAFPLSFDQLKEDLASLEAAETDPALLERLLASGTHDAPVQRLCNFMEPMQYHVHAVLMIYFCLFFPFFLFFFVCLCQLTKFRHHCETPRRSN